MVSAIKGTTVTLIEKTQNGSDDFGHPIWSDTAVSIDNVLVEPASDDAIVSELELSGKHMSYILHIPKSDAHNWKNAEVQLPAPWSVKVKTYGDCLVYDPALTPLDWNKKVKAELYE